MIGRFTRDKRGNFAIILALMAPVLLGAGGVGLDYAQLYRQQSLLQDVADASALANTQDSQAKAIVEEFARANFANADGGDPGALTVDSKVDRIYNSVKVNLSYKWAPMFAQLFDAGATPIKVSATARLAGKGITCVIGLLPDNSRARSAIYLEARAKLLADDCEIYSNTDRRKSISLGRSARIRAHLICSAGGVLLSRFSKITPQAVTDCPKIGDPLAKRPQPFVGDCDHAALAVTADARLTPGVYCGGLTIGANAKVEFDPGIYIVKDGRLAITGSASIRGAGVAFFLTGAKSVFSFDAGTGIDLAAPRDGPLAEILFMEAKDVPYSFDFDLSARAILPPAARVHRISSNNARNLLGIFYLLKSVLMVDANAPVADASPWTAIVAGALWLKQGPTLVLNGDYTRTEIPVPGGMIGARPALVD